MRKYTTTTKTVEVKHFTTFCDICGQRIEKGHDYRHCQYCDRIICKDCTEECDESWDNFFFTCKICASDNDYIEAKELRKNADDLFDEFTERAKMWKEKMEE